MVNGRTRTDVTESDAAASARFEPEALRLGIEQEALRLGFEAAGFAPLRRSDHEAFYRAWLAAGRHGTMGYLEREDAVARRLDPQRAWPGLKSAIVVTHRYAGGGEEDVSDASRGVIARYARGRDYHKVMKPRLLALLRFVEAEVGRALPLARAYVDTGPVLERELAQRAGLGWFGRNTMLLHPRRGSWFFLGTLLVEIELAPSPPFTRDHCGRCNACVTACPTGALLGRDERGAPVIDATRCISYLTIEQRGPIPLELRPLIGNRIFGCDICQEVCPYTRKFSRPVTELAFQARAGRESPSLIDWMRMSPEDWTAFSRRSPIKCAKRRGFLRNVAVALGNHEAPVVSSSTSSPPQPSTST